MKPMLNLGCGRIILPSDKPNHHALVDNDIYSYPEWVNIDKNMQLGVNKVMDLFCYPWKLPSDSFGGALLSHVAEHIPHSINVNPRTHDGYDLLPNDPLAILRDELRCMQDGWFAFFSELWRVLEHGAVVHVLSPYGHGDDAINDPSHTRYLTEYSLRHSMQPNPDAPFEYNHKLHFDVQEQTGFRPTPRFEGDPYFIGGVATPVFWDAKLLYNNVVHEFYTKLVCIKE